MGCLMKQPGKKEEQRIYHVNLLKDWKARENLFIILNPEEVELRPQVNDCLKVSSISLGKNLKHKQKEHTRQLVTAFPQVFSAPARKMFLAQHCINTEPNKITQEEL